MKYRTIFVIAVVCLLSGGTFSQSSTPQLKVLNVSRKIPFTALVPLDLEVKLKLTNTTGKDMFILGRYVNGDFDPTGKNFKLVSRKRNKIEWFDDKEPRIFGEGIARYVTQMMLKPGESLKYLEWLPSRGSFCETTFPVYFRFSQDEEIKKVMSDWALTGSDPKCRNPLFSD